MGSSIVRLRALTRNAPENFTSTCWSILVRVINVETGSATVAGNLAMANKVLMRLTFSSCSFQVCPPFTVHA